MLSNDRKRMVRHRLLAENTADKRGNFFSFNSFVTFVVRNVGLCSGDRCIDHQIDGLISLADNRCDDALQVATLWHGLSAFRDPCTDRHFREF